MQFTINSFRQPFPGKIFSLTIPWFSVKSPTFPWQLSHSLTFPGFPDKWSPCGGNLHQEWFIHFQNIMFQSFVTNGWTNERTTREHNASVSRSGLERHKNNVSTVNNRNKWDDTRPNYPWDLPDESASAEFKLGMIYGQREKWKTEEQLTLLPQMMHSEEFTPTWTWTWIVTTSVSHNWRCRTAIRCRLAYLLTLY